MIWRRLLVAALAVCALGAGCFKLLSTSSDVDPRQVDPPAVRPVYGVSISYGERWMLSYGADKAIHLQRLTADRPEEELHFQNVEVQSAVFLSGEMALVACYVDGSVVRWLRESGGWRPQLLGRVRNEVLCCAVSPRGDLLAVGSSGGDVIIWELDSGLRRKRTLKHARAVWSIDFSPDGAELAVSGAGSLLKRWNLQTIRASDVANDVLDVCTVAAWSPDGSRLLAGGLNGMLQMTDRTSGRVLWTTRAAKHGIRAATFSPDGRVLAIGAVFSGNVQLRDAQTGRLLRTVPAHHTTVSQVRFLSDGTLISSSHDGSIEAHDGVLPATPR